MATLSVTRSSLAGTLAPSFVAAAGGGDAFPNTGKEFLHVINGGGSPVTVTIDSPTLCSFGTSHDVAVSVTNGTAKIIGPFDPARFNDVSNLAQVTYSGVTSVTVAVVSN